MKKISVFLIIVFGVFCWALDDVSAETKIFTYYPEPEKRIGEDLWGIVKDVFSLSRNAVAETITRSEKQNEHFFDDHHGLGATDKFFGFSTPAEKWYVSDKEIAMRQKTCDGKPPAQNATPSLWGFLPDFFKNYLAEPALARAGNCHESASPYNTYYPYYVAEAKVVTDRVDNFSRNDKDCKMDIFITRGHCDKYSENHGSRADYCWHDGGKSLTAFLDLGFLGEKQKNETACAHIRLEDTKGWFGQVQWGGHLEIVGKKGSLDRFAITGVDAKTGKSTTVFANQTLQICKNTDVGIEWRTSDGVKEVKLLGINNGSEWVKMNDVNGSIGDVPQVTTTYYLQYNGYTGSGTLWQLVGPITIDPIDCQGASVSLSANPEILNEKGSSTLSWDSKGMEYCWAVDAEEGWNADRLNIKGSQQVTVPKSTVYEIQCRSTIDGTTKNAWAKVVVGDHGYCDPMQNNGKGQNFLCLSPNKCCNENNTCESCSPDMNAGDLSVKVRLNGQEVSTPVAVEYQFLGPQTLQGSSAPHTFNNIDANSANSYVGKYISGGPANSKFLGFSQSPVHVVPGKATTVYMDFTDGAGLCNITVQAIKTSCDGSNQYPWTGSLSYGLLGPAILNGLSVNQTFETIPAGRYYLTSLMGGPGTYNGVTPGNPVACPSGGNVTLTMKFRDCGETNYKCNYATGRCESCALYSDECKYNNASECNMQCAGCTEAHAPVSNIFCWASLDSDTCTGVNDANPDTPPVILYNRSSDSCGDTESCRWEIYDSKGVLVQSANSCAPYPWYDETPGTFTSKLTVTDSQNNSSTDTQKFTIKNIEALTCNFVWDPISPTANGLTSFFDQTLTPKGTTLKSWSWTFEGATPASSTAQNISNVRFNSAGSKTVTLTVKNSAERTCTLTKKIQIKTINPYWKETIPQ